MAAAAPSVVGQQSRSPKGHAMIGAFSTCSTVISLRRWALSFLAPLAWFFTATLASVSRPRPKVCM